MNHHIARTGCGRLGTSSVERRRIYHIYNQYDGDCMLPQLVQFDDIQIARGMFSLRLKQDRQKQADNALSKFFRPLDRVSS